MNTRSWDSLEPEEGGLPYKEPIPQDGETSRKFTDADLVTPVGLETVAYMWPITDHLLTGGVCLSKQTHRLMFVPSDNGKSTPLVDGNKAAGTIAALTKERDSAVKMIEAVAEVFAQKHAEWRNKK